MAGFKISNSRFQISEDKLLTFLPSNQTWQDSRFQIPDFRGQTPDLFTFQSDVAGFKISNSRFQRTNSRPFCLPIRRGRIQDFKFQISEDELPTFLPSNQTWQDSRFQIPDSGFQRTNS
jgi:hypothetical protein